MLSPRTRQGVTLIELLIVISIMATLMMLALPSFSKWLQSTQIRTASEAILAGVQLARAEAVRRNATVQFQLTTSIDNSCTLSTTGANWVVSLDSAAGSCGATPSADLAIPVSPRIIQVRAGVDGSRNAIVSASQSSISFNGLGRISPIPAGEITISVTNPTGGACADAGPMRCLDVRVSPTGQVRLCDPRTSSAQACS